MFDIKIYFLRKAIAMTGARLWYLGWSQFAKEGGFAFDRRVRELQSKRIGQPQVNYQGQQCQNQCRLNTDFDKDEDEAITDLSLVGTKLAIEAVTTSRSP